MGKLLQIAVTLIFIATVSACANSGGDKWSKNDSTSGETSDSSWQKNQDSTEGSKKADSSYWKEDGRY